MFEDEKQHLIKWFGNKKGVTDEVLNSIAATYNYLRTNHPEEIDPSEIPDYNTFKINSNNKKVNLSIIYLNRIYNNVDEFVHTPSPTGVSEFEKYEKKVYVPSENDIDWDNRLKHWPTKNLTEEEIIILRNKLRAKVITHELIHAASFNGKSVGFLSTSLGKNRYTQDELNKLAQQYNTDWKNIIGFTELEEMITEILALEIVENNNVKINTFVQNGKKTSYKSRNPDSSNHTLNPVAEYLVRCYPELIKLKFTDGLKFLAWFNTNNEMDQKSWPNFTEIVLKNYPYNIRDLYKKNQFEKSNTNIATLQELFLNRYKKHISIKTPEEVQKYCEDIVSFRFFALRENTNIHPDILKNIEEIENIVIAQCEQIAISKTDFENIMSNCKQNHLNKANTINTPYTLNTETIYKF